MKTGCAVLLLYTPTKSHLALSLSGHKNKYIRLFCVFVSENLGFCIPYRDTNTRVLEKNSVTTHSQGVTIHENRQNWPFSCVEGPDECVHIRIVSIVFEQIEVAATRPIPVRD